jgi:serine/threonine protein kinase/Tol biopolymer transport system component
MALTSGTKLGPYEILSPLGAGGMGEVYRARDTRLDRTVAIKVLNSQLTASAELKARFDREAKVISQLQHPNICVLHDIGAENGTDFLVMEFLEGESLNEKLKRGPLATDELLKISIQLADALEKAHRAGIIHRDLKPGNVMLTKSSAKLLDFGLAKPMAASGASSANTSASIFAAAATVTSPGSPLSSVGTIIGTVQYMAPEQIQGLEADARSDIFAFGLLLYEMATGKHAFEGKTQTSVVGQILAVNPVAISTLQPKSPPALSRLVSTCLEKDPDERFQTIHDVKLRLVEISEALASPAEIGTAAPLRTKNRMLWLTTTAAIVLIAIAATYFSTTAFQPKPVVVRSAILAPDKTTFVTTQPDSGVPVLSPDGTRLAFIARDSKGILWLYVRAINSLTAQPLAGTAGAIHPFWSPDSRNLGFFSDGKLRRIDANGGPTQELAPADRGRGGAWSTDAIILFCPGINEVLYRIPASGGTAVPATKLGGDETGHRWPYFLPDGKHFIFWSRGAKPHICVGSLDSLEHKQIIDSAVNATYAAPGYLVFVRGGTLMAQPFNAGKLAVVGDAIPVAQNIAINGASFHAVFSTSETGLLVYQTGGVSGGWQMQWAGRDGKATRSVPGFSTFLEPAISPDGKRIAVSFADASGNIDVWLVDDVRGTKTRLTFNPANDSYQIWTPDSARIIFSSTRNHRADLFSKAVDGSGNEEVVLQDDSDKTWKSISPDGRYLAYQRSNPEDKVSSEIWVLPLFGERKPFPIVNGPFLAYTPVISPDGKWMAYAGDESTSRQIYITPFPGGGPKWQVSTTDGIYPKWRGDGKELYFVTYGGAMTAVDVATSGASVTLGTPHVLFNATLEGLNWGPYDVSRDGKQFLLNGSAAQDSDTPLTLVTSWLSEIKK